MSISVLEIAGKIELLPARRFFKLPGNFGFVIA